LVFIDAVVFGIGVVYFEEEGRWWWWMMGMFRCAFDWKGVAKLFFESKRKSCGRIVRRSLRSLSFECEKSSQRNEKKLGQKFFFCWLNLFSQNFYLFTRRYLLWSSLLESWASGLLFGVRFLKKQVEFWMLANRFFTKM
jgi:hypothetical protein